MAPLKTISFQQTSVNVSVVAVSICSVDVAISVDSGFGKIATLLPSINFRRSTGLWPTFSNSSVSVSDSHPLKNYKIILLAQYLLETPKETRTFSRDTDS